MAEQPKIVVDIGVAMQTLEANPDLARKMNEFVLGPVIAEQLAAYERENSRLREALEPFAGASRVYDGTAVEDNDLVLSTDGPSLTAGDLRRARAALKETTA